MATVTISDVWKYYGKTMAVKELNLEIQDNEFMCILGPSGCGKSSTLRMLAGLEFISSGDIYFDDVRVNDLPPRDRDIAMVFENYALYPHKTVYENMANPLKLRRTPRDEIERRVRRAAEILEFDPLLGRKPVELSGGQKQRTAIGRAIVREPKVFLSRRADRPPGRQAALPHARRAQAPAARPRDHDRLRHPRPARRHVDGGSHRG